MAKFTKNDRIDPYKNFKFLLFFEGQPDPVAGVSKISPLKRTTEVVSHSEGGDQSTSRKSPGRTNFEPITFERGLTHDSDFEKWANLVYSTEGDAAISLAGYKRNLLIVVNDEQGNPAIAHRVLRAWVSEYTATAELDANANAVLIETIVAQNEGIEKEEVLSAEKVQT
jgi:phage tail-like protein